MSRVYRPEEREIRSAYGPAYHRVFAQEFGGESRTHQSFKDETDINRIMDRFERTGIIEHQNRFEGDYGDYTGVADYHVSLNRVIAAQEAFMTLPAGLRAKFANDPGEFMDAVNDPERAAELQELGVLPKPPVPPEEGAQGSSPKETPEPPSGEASPSPAE